jgi:hypothetical protein
MAAVRVENVTYAPQAGVATAVPADRSWHSVANSLIRVSMVLIRLVVITMWVLAFLAGHVNWTARVTAVHRCRTQLYSNFHSSTGLNPQPNTCSRRGSLWKRGR